MLRMYELGRGEWNLGSGKRPSASKINSYSLLQAASSAMSFLCSSIIASMYNKLAARNTTLLIAGPHYSLTGCLGARVAAGY